MLMAGGTGGHVFPALAIADALRTQGLSVCWLGTLRGLEARVVPEANIDIHYISIHGLRGKGKLSLLGAPFKIALA
ncbi:MAG: glycosyltransferase, partial [Thiomargarita sp.]|nr:glycosyltransferase [Thiomargarita sp.]